MDTVKLNWKPEFELSGKGNKMTLYAPFWLQINEMAFPCEEWTDFPLPILEYWIQEALSTPTGGNTEYEVCFMDGPYCVACTVEGDIVRLSCATYEKEEKLLEGTCSRKDFYHALQEAAGGLLAALEAKKIPRSRDISKLKKRFKELNKYLQKMSD